MILSAQSIRKRTGMVLPFWERQIMTDGLSYGLSSCGYDIRIDQDLYIKPAGYMLGSSMEVFDIPHDLAMHIRDKSTWARRGVFVQNTIAEPGWKGFLTLEISNLSDHYVSILKGTPIAQMIFEQLDEPTEQPYSGKYQNQLSGPQVAR